MKPKYIKYEDNLKPEEMEAPVYLVQASAETRRAAKGKTVWPLTGFELLRAYGKQPSFFVEGHKITNSGLDLGAGKGKPIRAIAAGEVVFVGCDHWGSGNVITLRHDLGFMSNYKHLMGHRVKEGDRLQAGEVFAWVGDTGQAATIGTMLRLETAYYEPSSKTTRYFDPREVLPAPKP